MFATAASSTKRGCSFWGNDELVRSRPELFARFALGYREVVAVREALARADLEKERALRARALAAAQKEEPPQPARVVAVKEFNHGGETIAVGSVWLKSHAVVQSAPSAFTPVIEN